MKIEVFHEDGGYTAICGDIPQIYGWGETEGEARAMLIRELRSLREDLQKDDNFSDEFLRLKEKLTFADKLDYTEKDS